MYTTPTRLLLMVGGVIVLIAAAIYFFTAGKVTAPTDQVATTTPEVTTNTNDVTTITWKINETETNASGVPHAEVSVDVDGRTTVVGTYAGTCTELRGGGVDGKGLLAGELSAVQCWWAGGGTEIGVFAHEDGGYDILVGELGEPTAEEDGFRGNFKVQVSL